MFLSDDVVVDRYYSEPVLSRKHNACLDGTEVKLSTWKNGQLDLASKDGIILQWHAICLQGRNYPSVACYLMGLKVIKILF